MRAFHNLTTEIVSTHNSLDIVALQRQLLFDAFEPKVLVHALGFRLKFEQAFHVLLGA